MEIKKGHTVPYQMNTELVKAYLLNIWLKTDESHHKKGHYQGAKPMSFMIHSGHFK